MSQPQIQLSPVRAAHLLDRVIYERVQDAIDRGKIAELQEQLAISLSLLPDVTDAEMLAGARAAIARALRDYAHDIEHPLLRDPEHHIRYLNAICAEVDPGPGRGASGFGLRASTDPMNRLDGDRCSPDARSP